MKTLSKAVLTAGACVSCYLFGRMSVDLKPPLSGYNHSSPGAKVDTAAAKSVSPPDAISSLFERVMDAAAIKSIDDCRILAKQIDLITDERLRHFAREMLLRRWTALDPKGALTYCGNLKNWGERELFTRVALREWAKNDSNSAIVWLNQLPPGKNQQVLTLAVVDGIADTNIASVCEFIGRFESSQLQIKAFYSVAERVARNGGSAVEDALKKLPSALSKQTAANIFINYLAAVDPKAAIQLAQENLKSSEARLSATSTAFAYWASQNPSDALAAIRDLPAAMQPGATQSAFAAIVHNNPAQAIELFEGKNQSIDNDTFTRVLTKEWSDNDPVAAFNWLTAHPSQATEEAVRNVFYNWTEYSKPDAIRGAMTITAPKVRDSALAMIAEKLTFDEPDLAVQTVLAIGDPEVKQRTTRSVIGLIQTADPANAEKLKKQYGL